MRRRTKDPKKCQEVFLFALEALNPFWIPSKAYCVHDEVLIDLETGVDLAAVFKKKPGLITASGISAIANNQGSSVLTKKMIQDTIEKMKDAMTKAPDWVIAVPPTLSAEAKQLIDELTKSESAEWSSLEDSPYSGLDV